MTLRVGQTAPDFDVRSSSGKSLRLSELIGKKNVVLYFYPGDFTMVCTRETCGFRDAYADLADKDTEVIGISTDSDDSHERFAKEYAVPFALVADTNRELARTYEAENLLTKLLGRLARVTYVIDKKGTIAGVFKAQLSANEHVQGVKDLIAKLS
ncbi:MAG: peroxiredoxin [Labilithrix sp.]|nr:peroxiredoxin [Labilithrix sp.]MCW5809541.1 peroxiredoxin [Labilithrix sp.]